MSAFEKCGHAIPQANYCLHGICIFCYRDRLGVAVGALLLIASGPRPDGTYNRDRKACEQLAKEALKEIGEVGK